MIYLKLNQCEGGLTPPNNTKIGWTVLVVCAAMSGCTLPDVKPFALATTQIETSLEQGFVEAARAQRNMAGLLDETKVPGVKLSPSETESLETTRNTYIKYAAEIEKQAASRMVLLRAVSDYADALAAIIDAAESAQANVDKLGDAVIGLAKQFSSSPLPKVVEGVADLTELLARESIKLKAANDLTSALTHADPVIQKAATLFRNDLDSLSKSVATKKNAIEAAFGLIHGTRIKYYENLLKRRQELIAKLTSGDSAIEESEDSASLKELETQIQNANQWYEPSIAQQEEALRQVRQAERLFVETRAAIDAWKSAHTDLLAAVSENRRSFNVRRLVELSLEIKRIVDSMRKSNED